MHARLKFTDLIATTSLVSAVNSLSVGGFLNIGIDSVGGAIQRRRQNSTRVAAV